MNTVCVENLNLGEPLYVHTYRLYVQTYSSTYVRNGIDVDRASIHTSGQKDLYVQNPFSLKKNKGYLRVLA